MDSVICNVCCVVMLSHSFKKKRHFFAGQQKERKEYGPVDTRKCHVSVDVDDGSEIRGFAKRKGVPRVFSSLMDNCCPVKLLNVSR